MDDFYRDLGQTWRKAVRAFADAGCRYLQLDETNLTYLCDPEAAPAGDRARRRSRQAAVRLCRHDQRRDRRHPGRHDHHHASLPRQFPLDLHQCRRRLRADRGDAVQHHQGARLFHGVRQRALRRLRAAALRAEGQDRGARARHLQDRHARKQGRDQAPHRRGREIRRPRPALPVAAMRLRLDRGRQYPRRGGAVGEAPDDRRIGGGGVGRSLSRLGLPLSSRPSDPRLDQGSASRVPITTGLADSKMWPAWLMGPPPSRGRQRTGMRWQGIVSGKVAIVTGAARGIGRGIALGLAQEGAKVVACDIGASLQGAGADAGPAQQVVDEIKQAGGEAIASTLSIARSRRTPRRSSRPRSRPSAASTSWSTMPASCATRSSTA